MKLVNVVEINVGKNTSRIKTASSEIEQIYTNEDFLADFGEKINTCTDSHSFTNSNKFVLEAGDLVYNLFNSTAAIVSDINSGKLINQNFAKLVVNKELVDPRYLFFMLNESESIKHQSYILMQGSVIPKMTPAILRQLKIKLPALERQHLIGRYYMNFNRYQRLKQEELELLKQMNHEILNKLSQS